MLFNYYIMRKYFNRDLCCRMCTLFWVRCRHIVFSFSRGDGLGLVLSKGPPIVSDSWRHNLNLLFLRILADDGCQCRCGIGYHESLNLIFCTWFAYLLWYTCKFWTNSDHNHRYYRRYEGSSYRRYLDFKQPSDTSKIAGGAGNEDTVLPPLRSTV